MYQLPIYQLPVSYLITMFQSVYCTLLKVQINSKIKNASLLK